MMRACANLLAYIEEMKIAELKGQLVYFTD